MSVLGGLAGFAYGWAKRDLEMEMAASLGTDMAVDLGSANTVVYVRGSGAALIEPSVVAIDVRTGMVHAFGYEADELWTRMPATFSKMQPLKHPDGAFADLAITEALLRYFIQKVQQDPNAHPRIVLCAPPNLTDEQERTLQQVCLRAGAREAYLLADPIAGAMGAGLSVGESTAWGAVRAGLPLDESAAWLLVDVGAQTTTVSVITDDGLALSRSVRAGGDEFDDAIARNAQQMYGLLIPQRTAEEIKLEIGSACALSEELQVEIRGRDASANQHKTAVLTSEEVRQALNNCVLQIIETVKGTLDHARSELLSRVTAIDIVVVGGGALLPGIAARLRAELALPCRVADSPLVCAALGAGRWMEQTPAQAPPQVNVRMMTQRIRGR